MSSTGAASDPQKVFPSSRLQRNFQPLVIAGSPGIPREPGNGRSSIEPIKAKIRSTSTDREPEERAEGLPHTIISNTYRLDPRKDVSLVSTTRERFGISGAALFRTLVKIVPVCICFVAHLICASLAKIKAAKSQICIIDRANINTREGPVVQGLNKQIISSAEIMHVSADPRRWVQAQIYQSTQSQSAVRYRSLCHSGIAGETTHSLVGLMTKSPQLQCLMDMILRSSS